MSWGSFLELNCRKVFGCDGQKAMRSLNGSVLIIFGIRRGFSASSGLGGLARSTTIIYIERADKHRAPRTTKATVDGPRCIAASHVLSCRCHLVRFDQYRLFFGPPFMFGFASRFNELLKRCSETHRNEFQPSFAFFYL